MTKFLALLRAIIPILIVLAGVGLSYRTLARRYPAIRISALTPKRTKKTDSTQARAHNPIEKNVRAVLKELEVREDDIRTQLYLEDTLREIHAKIPRGKPLEWAVYRLSQAADKTDYRFSDCIHRARSGVTTLFFDSKNSNKPRLALSFVWAERYLSNASTMALLLENFNFEADQTTIGILSFPEPLTISLATAARKAAWTAQAAREYNKEVVISLPLEPKIASKTQYRKTMIMVHYPAEKIRAMIDQSVQVIPRFAGFGNLYGSRACEDSRVIGILMEKIASRRGYFVETKTARNSVVEQLARQHGVPYARVDARLEPEADAREIEEQLKHLSVIAQKKGGILIAATASGELVAALRRVVPFLKQNGIRLVYVSTIVNQYTSR